jgi:hypothetical protein
VSPSLEEEELLLISVSSSLEEEEAIICLSCSASSDFTELFEGSFRSKRVAVERLAMIFGRLHHTHCQ